MDSQYYYQHIMHDIVSQSDSSLIIFFVLAIITMILFIIPFYVIILKDRKEKRLQHDIRHKRYIEREREILRVVTANTEAITSLKSTIDIVVSSSTASFMRIHERIDEQSKMIATLVEQNREGGGNT